MRELLRRVLVWVKCWGRWCDACQLDSHFVPHTCPQRERHTFYVDDDGRLIEFGRIIGAVEGPPKRSTVRKRPRRLKLAPDLQKDKRVKTAP